MTQSNEFSASWDGLVKGVTVSVCALIVTLTIIFVLVLNSPFLRLSFTVLFGSVLILPYLWAPRGYAVERDVAIIRRVIGDLEINVSEQPRQWKWTWWGLRLFGSGGMYGYFGFFIFKGLGRTRMYATNRHTLVLIKDNKGRKYLVSPKEPERFIELLATKPDHL